MTRVDLAFPSMGGEAVVRLESASLDRAALEQLAEGVHARIETVEAALSRFRPGSDCPVELSRLAARYFDSDGALKPGAHATASNDAYVYAVWLEYTRKA